MYNNLNNDPQDNNINEPTDEELEMIERNYFLED